MRTISDYYAGINAILHQSNPQYGDGVATSKWYPQIEALASAIGSSSIIDYGCGKGKMARACPTLIIDGYDPAVEEFAANPDPSDIVVCLDVLEHVEPEFVTAVLDHIAILARKAVFLTVSTRPAGKTLADGRNAHLSVHPAEWWVRQMIDRWEMRMFSTQNDEFVFFGLAKPDVQLRMAE